MSNPVDPNMTGDMATVADTVGVPSGVFPAIPGYQILDELGRGGMGVVFKAHQLLVNRVVALKMVLAGTLASPLNLLRFLSEAEAVAKLQHPNIVGVYEFGQHESLPYFTMEFIEGGSLSRYARTPQPPRTAAQVVQQIASGVGYAHAQGILHRDLKPENILLQKVKTEAHLTGNSAISELQTAVPKITDFGLAKRLETTEGLTTTGAVLGTPSYMAPEQAEGNRAIGPSADVWSVGVILYQLLTGRLPFLGPTVFDTIRLVLEAEPAHPSQLVPQLPPDLVTICLKCLRKEPSQRYQSGAELADDLRRFLDGQPILARPVGVAERMWKWVKRNRVIAAAAGVVALSLIAATILSSLFAVRAGMEAQRASASESLATQRAEDASAAEVAAREARDQASRLLYVSNLRLTQELWDRPDGSPRAISEILSEHVPTRPGDPDFREFAWRMQWTRLNRSAVTLREAPGWRRVALSPDRRVTTIDKSGKLRVLDPATGRVVREVAGGRPNAEFFAVSPDGRFAAFSEANQLILLDAVPGKSRHISAAKWQPLNVEFAPNGKFMVVVCSDRTARVFDPATGAETGSVTLKGSALRALAVTPDGQTVILGNHPGLGEVTAYSLATKSSRHLHRFALTVLAVACSADGTRLAMGDFFGGVAVFDLLKGTILVRRVPLFPGQISRLSFSPNGSRLAGSGADGFLATWPVTNPRSAVLLKGHESHVIDVAWSGVDEKMLLSIDMAGVLKIWDLTRPSSIHKLDNRDQTFDGAVFDRDGTWLTTSSDGKIEIWNMSRGNVIREFNAQPPQNARVALSPDRSLVASGDADSRLTVFDAANGKVLWRTKEIPLTAYGPASPTMPMNAPQYKRAVADLAFSGDNRLLAAGFGTRNGRIGNYDQKIQVWDARTGAERASLKVRNTVSRLRFSPDGKELIAGCHDGTIRSWIVGDGERTLAEELKYDAMVTALDLSADGTLLAIGLSNGGLVLRDRHTGKEIRRPSGHTGAISNLAISPDRRTIATVGNMDGYLKFWETVSLRPTVAIRMNRLTKDLAFSPNGNLLMAATGDGVRLLPAAPLEEIDQEGQKPGP